MYFCLCFNDTATTEIYTYLHTLSLPDALPIFQILQLDDVLVEHRECEAFASGKVPVEAALADAGRAGDQAERSSKSLGRSDEHTSELQSLMRTSYAVFCLKKKITIIKYKT